MLNWAVATSGDAESSGGEACRELLRGLGASAPHVADAGAAAFAVSVRGDALFALADGLVVLADARLDNHPDLAHSLGLSRDTGTAETIAHAWRRWGAETPDRLIGEFAVAIHDPRSGSLHLFRDPVGTRALYYRAERGRLLAGPSARALAALGGAPKPDLAVLGADLWGARDLGGRSFWRGVQCVRAGEIVRFDGRIARRLHFQPALDPDLGSDDQFIERYRALLDEAVSCRLAATGPTATHLSSGYDSASVTATAASLTDPARIMAFTSAPIVDRLPTPKGRMADESPIAAALARTWGIAHHVVRPSRSPLEIWRTLTPVYEMPLRDPFNLGWWTQIAQACSDAGCAVLLNAELGNLTLNFGGPGVLATYVAHGRWARWAREASAALRRPEFSWRGVAFNSFEPFLPRRVALSLRGNSEELLSFASPEFRPISIGEALDSSPESRLALLRTMDSGLYRRGALLTARIDERDVMADRRIIEFGLRLPPEQLFRQGRARPLARRALADRLPQSLIEQPRRGLQSADWALRMTSADAHAALEEVSASSNARRLLDLPKMRAALADWPAQRANDPAITGRYRLAFCGALAAGYFLLSAEGRL